MRGWPNVVYCWGSVEDGGPAVKQRWANVSCLLGIKQTLGIDPMWLHRLRYWSIINQTNVESYKMIARNHIISPYEKRFLDLP